MSDIKIGRMVLGAYQTNCYFLYREDEKDVIVVDPGDQGANLYNALRRNGFAVRAILLTHGHFDHIWGLNALKDAACAAAETEGQDPVLVYACEDERALLKSAELNVSQQAGRPCRVSADVYVKDGQTLELAGISLRVIATPGHTAGSCCFLVKDQGETVLFSGDTLFRGNIGKTQGSCCYYAEEAGILVAGDTLFQESVGRSDFPTGSSSTLIRSVQDKLFALPDETRVYPGHGESTTIGHEKRYNPFCALTE